MMLLRFLSIGLHGWTVRPTHSRHLLEKVLSKQVPNFSQTVLDYLDAS